MENIAKLFFYLSLCNQQSTIKLINPMVLDFMKNMIKSKYSTSKTIIHLLNAQINFFYLDQKNYKMFSYLTKCNLLRKFLLSKFASVKLILMEPFINIIQVFYYLKSN